MNEAKADPKADIVLAVVVLLFAGTVYWQTLDLPPPRYEPLGPAALPRALCALMAVFASIILARGIRGLRAGISPARGDPGFRRRPVLAVGTYALTAAYVAVMDLRLVGFVPASLAFLVLVGLVLSRLSWREIPWIAGFAAVLALGSYIVFTRWFYIDLP